LGIGLKKFPGSLGRGDLGGGEFAGSWGPIGGSEVWVIGGKVRVIQRQMRVIGGFGPWGGRDHFGDCVLGGVRGGGFWALARLARIWLWVATIVGWRTLGNFEGF
jgi:hypothetical protein